MNTTQQQRLMGYKPTKYWWTHKKYAEWKRQQNKEHLSYYSVYIKLHKIQTNLRWQKASQLISAKETWRTYGGDGSVHSPGCGDGF